MRKGLGFDNAAGARTPWGTILSTRCRRTVPLCAELSARGLTSGHLQNLLLPKYQLSAENFTEILAALPLSL